MKYLEFFYNIIRLSICVLLFGEVQDVGAISSNEISVEEVRSYYFENEILMVSADTQFVAVLFHNSDESKTFIEVFKFDPESLLQSLLIWDLDYLPTEIKVIDDKIYLIEHRDSFEVTAYQILSNNSLELVGEFRTNERIRSYDIEKGIMGLMHEPDKSVTIYKINQSNTNYFFQTISYKAKVGYFYFHDEIQVRNQSVYISTIPAMATTFTQSPPRVVHLELNDDWSTLVSTQDTRRKIINSYCMIGRCHHFEYFEVFENKVIANQLPYNGIPNLIRADLQGDLTLRTWSNGSSELTQDINNVEFHAKTFNDSSNILFLENEHILSSQKNQNGLVIHKINRRKSKIHFVRRKPNYYSTTSLPSNNILGSSVSEKHRDGISKYNLFYNLDLDPLLNNSVKFESYNNSNLISFAIWKHNYLGFTERSKSGDILIEMIHMFGGKNHLASSIPDNKSGFTLHVHFSNVDKLNRYNLYSNKDAPYIQPFIKKVGDFAVVYSIDYEDSQPSLKLINQNAEVIDIIEIGTDNHITKVIPLRGGILWEDIAGSKKAYKFFSNKEPELVKDLGIEYVAAADYSGGYLASFRGSKKELFMSKMGNDFSLIDSQRIETNINTRTKSSNLSVALNDGVLVVGDSEKFEIWDVRNHHHPIKHDSIPASNFNLIHLYGPYLYFSYHGHIYIFEHGIDPVDKSIKISPDSNKNLVANWNWGNLYQMDKVDSKPKLVPTLANHYEFDTSKESKFFLVK